VSEAEERLMSGDAWRDFCDRLKVAGESILAEGFPAEPRDRAEGFRWLTRLITHATQMEVEAGDSRFPFFIRYETPHNQWGGPNPDNAYYRANIDPACTYRIWTDATGLRQAIFSLNEGEMQLGEFGVFAECSLDDLEVADDGLLEIWLSPEAQPRNWMRADPRGRLLTIRVFQSDWRNDAANAFHIERVGAEGEPRPALTPAFMERALDRSATWVERTATFWNTYTSTGQKRASLNVANPPAAAKGGADNILYGNCFWDLAPGEVLLLDCAPPDAQYFGFTIHTLGWLESGDFADRQTSLSGHQVHVDADGRMRIVISHEDPGAPNWIDTEGRRSGLLVYRWVWSRDNPVPVSEVIPVEQLREHVPADHPHVDEQARRRSLSQRREAAWNRFL
jgi:hypothetical protein